jgi:hypothetical protein
MVVAGEVGGVVADDGAAEVGEGFAGACRSCARGAIRGQMLYIIQENKGPMSIFLWPYAGTLVRFGSPSAAN